MSNKYRKKEEYVYKDLTITMSEKCMANVLYAGIETFSEFTTLWNMNRGKYTRKQNSRNSAHIKVHIHPLEIDNFNILSGLILKDPQIISGQ